MATYFMFNTNTNEIYLHNIATSPVYYGSVYIPIENASEFDMESKATITIMDNNLVTAGTFQPISIVRIDYEMESNTSEIFFTTDEGLVSSSMLDHHINFANMDTNEVEYWMDGIANGEYMDWEEEI